MTQGLEYPTTSSLACPDEKPSAAQDAPGSTVLMSKPHGKVHEISKQCLDLLAELDELQTLLKQTLRNPQLVEVRQFRSNVNSELKMLQKLEQQLQSSINSGQANCETQEESELQKRLTHVLRSSNLPFYQAVWNVAKSSCGGLVALGKRFYWDSETKATHTRAKDIGSGGREKQPSKDKRKSVFVDIVADEGKEWVKVSTLSETRLLFEMAKKGWERDSDGEISDDGERALRNFDGGADEEDDDELELIKLARDLRKAANAARVRYRHPRLRVVLPKILEGNSPDIDDIVNEMRNYGIDVVCQNGLSASSGTTGLSRLLPHPFTKFTPTLNIDCTLLLAMISDISHIKDMAALPNLNKAIVRQIEVEKEQPLLPFELWPAIAGHELVCTNEAATRMREIVKTIGTETENARMAIMMGDPPYDRSTQTYLVGEFQELSDYRVPSDWRIPVKVVDAQQAINAGKSKLPRVAEKVSQSLSDINHSVFMYGWVTGVTTISSNRTIDKQIETTIERNRQTDDDLEGPMVWICDTARSLVGKDKDRKT